MARRKPSYAGMKAKVDAAFSKLIRSKAADHTGNARCVSCGTVKHWKELQCGHYYSRIYLATRWDKRNCAPQCSKCNVLLRGNYPNYSMYMLEKYGRGVLSELQSLSNVSVKYTVKDLEQKLEEIRTELAMGMVE